MKNKLQPHGTDLPRHAKSLSFPPAWSSHAQVVKDLFEHNNQFCFQQPSAGTKLASARPSTHS